MRCSRDDVADLTECVISCPAGFALVAHTFSVVRVVLHLVSREQVLLQQRRARRVSLRPQHVVRVDARVA